MNAPVSAVRCSLSWLEVEAAWKTGARWRRRRRASCCGADIIGSYPGQAKRGSFAALAPDGAPPLLSTPLTTVLGSERWLGRRHGHSPRRGEVKGYYANFLRKQNMATAWGLHRHFYHCIQGSIVTLTRMISTHVDIFKIPFKMISTGVTIW